MKFATLTLSAISLASLIFAAPTPVEVLEDGKVVVKDVIIPEEAIVATQVIGDDQYPYVVELNGQKVVLLVNTTAAEEIVGPDFDMDSLRADLANSTEVEKRDANAEASPEARKHWHWITYRLGQPIAKREADAEASPDARKHWHWITYRLGQPIAKRDAVADTVKFFQPIAKREDTEEESSTPGFYWITQNIEL